MIMPYCDAGIHHRHFLSIQKIGATGILRGTGIPFQWANETRFYPDSLVNKEDLQLGLNDFGYPISLGKGNLTLGEGIALLADLQKMPFEKEKEAVKNNWNRWGLENFDLGRMVSRAELAVLLDKVIDPFGKKEIDLSGNFKMPGL
jgi:hypothetical protein